MPYPLSDRSPLVLPACTIDRVQRSAHRSDGRVERLSAREAELLVYFAENPDRTISREELHTRVWGYSPAVVSRAVDATVRRLRDKIEVDPRYPDHVLTAFGEGYRFVLDGPRPDPAGVPEEEEPFVGRSAEVQILLRALRDGGGSLLLHGPPGAGKTRIARHLAHRLATRRKPAGPWIDSSRRLVRAGRRPCWR